MQTTSNLGLKKPEGTDTVNINDLNSNMDILDTAVNNKIDKVSGKQLSTEDYTTAEKNKLAGIAAGANNYVHPSNHPPSIISQDSNNRFVTDAEKSTWNGKASTAIATTGANGLMSAADKVALNNATGYGVTAGTGAAYTVTLSPAPSGLTAGLRITVKFHTANTSTTPTINVNGLGAKTIVRPSGAIPTGLIKAAVYTLIYDGTNFISQGEGGEYGSAGAAQVLSGYTLGTDSGLVNGSMDAQPSQVSAVSVGKSATYPNNMYARIPDGGYLQHASSGYPEIVVSNAQIQAVWPDLSAANFRSDKNILGIQGTMPVKPFQNNPVNVVGGPGTSWVRLPPGAYVNTEDRGGQQVWEVTLSTPDLSPENFRSDKNILGVQGSMTVRPSKQNAVSMGSYQSDLYARIPLGAYVNAANGGNAEVVIPFSMIASNEGTTLQANNIRNGVNYYGVTGTLIEGKHSASGTTGAVSNSFNITGLNFTPSKVIYYPSTNGYVTLGVASASGDIIYEDGSSYKNFVFWVDSPYSNSIKTNATIFSYGSVTGLVIPIYNRPYNWFAYE